MSRLPFASGQPLLPHERANFGRTIEEALRDFKNAPEDRRRIRRRKIYSVPGNDRTRSITKRIVGEKDD